MDAVRDLRGNYIVVVCISPLGITSSDYIVDSKETISKEEKIDAIVGAIARTYISHTGAKGLFPRLVIVHFASMGTIMFLMSDGHVDDVDYVTNDEAKDEFGELLDAIVPKFAKLTADITVRFYQLLKGVNIGEN